VFTGSAVNALSEVTSDADADPGTGFESRVFLAADAGTTYYIQVGVKPSTAPGPVSLAWQLTAQPNDAFASAVTLAAADASLAAWNVGATLGPGAPHPGQPPLLDLGNTVWYSWTPTKDGRATLGVDADYNRPVLAVYTGSTFANLHEEASGVSTSVS